MSDDPLEQVRIGASLADRLPGRPTGTLRAILTGAHREGRPAGLDADLDRIDAALARLERMIRAAMENPPR